MQLSRANNLQHSVKPFTRKNLHWNRYGIQSLRMLLVMVFLFLSALLLLGFHPGMVHQQLGPTNIESQGASSESDDPNDPDDDCGSDSGESNSNDPVLASTGRKYASFNALTVPLSTGHFTIRYSYVSDPSYVSAPAAGRRWACNVLRFLKVEGTGTGRIITLHGIPKGKVVFIYDQSTSSWRKLGGGTQYIELTQRTISAITYDVWALVTPGKKTVFFYRDSDPPGAIAIGLAGQILQELDLQTNQVATYFYDTYGAQQAPAVIGSARLNRIALNGTQTGACERQIVVSLYNDGNCYIDRFDNPLSILTGFHLQNNSGIDLEVVSFYYRTHGDPNAVCPSHADLSHADVGPTIAQPSGSQPILDMVLNEKPANAGNRISIRQYRYHVNGVTSAPTGFSWVGESGQLKMQIEPEQIRLAYDLYRRAGNSALSFKAFGEHLRTLGDADAIYSGSSVRVIDLASKIIEQYEQTGDRRVKSQFIQSSCGCNGAGTQGVKLEYEYWSYGESPSTKTTMQMIESFRDPDSPNNWIRRRFFYFDSNWVPNINGVSVPYKVNEAIIEALDGEPTGRKWITHYQYDANRRLQAVYTPAAMASYVPFDPEDPENTPSYASGPGLVQVYAYNNRNLPTQTLVCNGAPSFDAGTGLCTNCELISSTDYGDADGSSGTEWTSSNSRDDIASRINRYRRNPLDPNLSPPFDPSTDVETVKMFYGFESSNSSNIKWSQVVGETELEAENGPASGSTGYSTFHLFDSRGREYWTKSPDGALAYRFFYNGTSEKGECLLAAANTSKTPPLYAGSSNGLPASHYGLSTTGSEWNGRYTDGGALITQFKFGKTAGIYNSFPTGVIGPNGMHTYITHINAGIPGEANSAEFPAEVSLPAEISTGVYDGPATVRWHDEKNNTVCLSTYEIANSSYLTDLNAFTFTHLGQELSREVGDYNIAGQLTRWRVWTKLDGNGPNGGVEDTRYFYDELGRLSYVIGPTGTVTKNTYDVMDRVVRIEVGIANGETPTDLRTISETFYDSDGSPAQGMGNGHVTLSRAHLGGTPPRFRDTKYTYDYRGRLIQTENAAAPHEVTSYDNLDRPIKQGLFAQVPGGNIDHASRNSYREIFYSQRGLKYLDRIAINPDPQQTVSAGFLSTRYWYDEMGRNICVAPPNGVVTKAAFDGLGRVVAVYKTDGGGDVSYADVYSLANHTVQLNGDIVFEQSNYTYVSPTPNPPVQATYTGALALVTKRLRTHTASESATGALSDIAVANSITTYSGCFYDQANRPTHMVKYGTNESLFQSGGAAPQILQGNPPARSDTELVSSLAYNSRGLVESTTDPAGVVTKSILDDLGRKIGLVENYDSTTVDLSWSAGLNRWIASNAGESVDRVTSFVYDGGNHTVALTAHRPDLSSPGDNDQVTRYAFGVSTTGDDPSDIASNDLLHTVIYPPGNGSVNEVDRTVLYGYNQQGELRFVRDQNKTEHTLTRDEFGRVVLDYTSPNISVPNPEVDFAINAIQYEFDAHNLLSQVSSYANYGTSGSIRNQVRYTRNALGAVVAFDQNHFGAVTLDGNQQPTGTTRRIGYSYDIQNSASGNRFRKNGLTYPHGSAIDYDYGQSSSVNDRISRLRAIKFDLEGTEYSYLGLTGIVGVDFTAPDVRLDYAMDIGGTATDGIYPGFDRFGRVRQQMWIDGNYGPTNPPSIANAAIPPIVKFDYSYDRNSNRTSAYDGRPGARRVQRDYQYTYDGVNRLTNAARGASSPSGFVHTGFSWLYAPSQDWNLDALGNWKTLTTDLNANGASASDSSDNKELRSHNSVNELLARDIDGSSTDDITLTYDAAGNLRHSDDGTTIITNTYDAWNRLVKVEYAPSSQPSSAQTRLVNQYNGLHHRIVKQSDSGTPDGSLDQQRLMYYNPGWPLLEEEIYDNGTPQHWGDLDRTIKYVWGLRGIDDILLRKIEYLDPLSLIGEKIRYHLTDPQFTSVAIIDGGSGSLITRGAVTPYGEWRHQYPHDVDGGGQVTSNSGGDFDTIYTLARGGSNQIGQSNYNVDADIDRDGVVSVKGDYNLAVALGTKPGLARGLISDPDEDNIIGYAGYVFNPETLNYTVRFRHYEPINGRWTQRDPLGNLANDDLYEYAGTAPGNAVDPFGLITSSVTIGMVWRGGHVPGCHWEPARSDGLRLVCDEGVSPGVSVSLGVKFGAGTNSSFAATTSTSFTWSQPAQMGPRARAEFDDPFHQAAEWIDEASPYFVTAYPYIKAATMLSPLGIAMNAAIDIKTHPENWQNTAAASLLALAIPESVLRPLLSGLRRGFAVGLEKIGDAWYRRVGGCIQRLDAAESAALDKAFSAVESAPGAQQGSFSIINWSGYPGGLPRPTGPFRILNDAEYDAARAAADKANRAIHKADPTLRGMQIHDIQPVKFGGNPIDPSNKLPLTPQQHAPATTWWQQLLRDLDGSAP